MEPSGTDAGAAAEVFARWACALRPADVPADVRTAVAHALLDHAGLCLAARRSDYVAAALQAWPEPGEATAIGHAGGRSAAAAAVLNGMAAHGEDFDDTFEGTPVHTGAVVLPAVLAACEAHGRSGAHALLGIAAGMELMCRMALVAPTAIHRAGFHPTAVIGALGAAVGVSVALGLSARQAMHALGIAGSMASGIIEYLAEGTWTKRLHPGWAAQSGLHAALLARGGFTGPRTVLEGEHGFFHAFGVPEVTPELGHVTAGLGRTWHAASIAFKPYACGTMCQPFIDATIALARQGLKPDDVVAIECEVGEGTVHRLWEPAAEKRSPSSEYSAKFSVPYCIAVALTDRAAGLEQFSAERVRDPRLRALAAKITYRVNPLDEYPRNYTGHLRVTRSDGSVLEARQPYLRGGRREPLTQAELESKFRANARYGGCSSAQVETGRAACAGLFEAPDLSALRALRL